MVLLSTLPPPHPTPPHPLQQKTFPLFFQKVSVWKFVQIANKKKKKKKKDSQSKVP
jgi:hypothetical protein